MTAVKNQNMLVAGCWFGVWRCGSSWDAKVRGPLKNRVIMNNDVLHFKLRSRWKSRKNRNQTQRASPMFALPNPHLHHPSLKSHCDISLPWVFLSSSSATNIFLHWRNEVWKSHHASSNAWCHCWDERQLSRAVYQWRSRKCCWGLCRRATVAPVVQDVAEADHVVHHSRIFCPFCFQW